MAELTHLDERGNAVMVDVTDKAVTERVAVATGRIYVGEAAFRAIMDGTAPKGDVLACARVAGIMAAKRTSELIPLCHPLMLTKVSVAFVPEEEQHAILCRCTAKLAGRTGVEMEALTGASVALLTVYDMCKALNRRMEISQIRLEEKTGGKNGHFKC